ncbi:ABC transporter permease subunit [Ktedonosporobacter rubrisoli]|uniref:ABC transporter permease subunit n=1 Tax=Ktedonosporobacter rubrisoli TaxID=2509675 RepID=A0A4P6K1B3_KTERU|nr:ABC transporter permease subunit [Ktedonosporobacter rubrisoli]QBD81775.1 ABC transporter permease subunit [Ktedonosporobacter rubrisoli]
MSTKVKTVGSSSVTEGSRQKISSGKASFGFDKLVLVLAMLYLLVPLGATLVFGLSGGSGLDLKLFQDILSDKDFSSTLLLSLELGFAATVLSVVLVTPTAYWVQLRLPRARPLLDFLSLVPFAVPAIIMSLGLLEVYGSPNPLIGVLSLGLVPLLSNPPFNIVNTPQLLVCAYVVLSLPFVYRPIDNSLRALNTRVLTEAAYSLGCGWWKTFLTVILPNVWPGVISAALLTFSTAMGEFTLATLFGLYTFPVYLNQTGQGDAHKAALLSIISFIFTLICVIGIILFARSRSGSAVEAAAAR